MKKEIPSYLIRLLIFLIFITTVSAAYLFLPDKPHSQNFSPATDTSTVDPTPLNSLTSETIISAPPPSTPTLTNTTTSTNTQQEKFLNATLKVNEKTYNLLFKNQETLFQAMQRLTIMSNQPFLFSGKEYPTLGYFVEEINEKQNNNKTGEYWIYYVNNQSAQTGISNYYLKEGDVIEWKYEKSKF